MRCGRFSVAAAILFASSSVVRRTALVLAQSDSTSNGLLHNQRRNESEFAWLWEPDAKNSRLISPQGLWLTLRNGAWIVASVAANPCPVHHVVYRCSDSSQTFLAVALLLAELP